MSESTGWVDRQMPAGDEVFLDHVGYFVADLDDAGQRLGRLGFQVSAVNVQTNDVDRRAAPVGYVEPDRPPASRVPRGVGRNPRHAARRPARGRPSPATRACTSSRCPTTTFRPNASGSRPPASRCSRWCTCAVATRRSPAHPRSPGPCYAHSPASCRKAASNSPRATILTVSGRPTRSCTPMPPTRSLTSCSASPTGAKLGALRPLHEPSGE